MPKKVKQAKFHFVRIPYWAFLFLFALSAGFTVYALRANNQKMVNLRAALYETDKNDGDINMALNNLRAFVYGHMNTDLYSGGNAIKPPIQLKYTYERLTGDEQARVKQANSLIYTEAQNYCQAQNPASFSGGPRVPCVEEYVTTHGEKANPVPAALYKFDFVSPIWSADLAGWSLVISTILLAAFLVSFLIDRLVRMQIKNQQL